MRARRRRARRDRSETKLSRPWEPPLRSALGLFGLTLNPESGVLRRNLGGAGGGHNCSQVQERFRTEGGRPFRVPGSGWDRGGQESDLARGSASPRADIICPNPQGTLEPEDGDGQSPRAESLVPQPAVPRRRNGGAPPRRWLYLSSPRRRDRAPARASDHRASCQGDAPSGVRVPRLRPARRNAWSSIRSSSSAASPAPRTTAGPPGRRRRGRSAPNPRTRQGAWRPPNPPSRSG